MSFLPVVTGLGLLILLVVVPIVVIMRDYRSGRTDPGDGGLSR